MITLTRLAGTVFVLNADLIERLDSTPDTVITLVDGKKYVVAESMSEITARVRAYRGEIIAHGTHLGAAPVDRSARPVHLAPVADHPSAQEVDG